MSLIKTVEACTVSVPLDRPIAFSTRTVQSREYTLVRIRDSDGLAGIGFCYVSNGGGDLATYAVLSLIAPALTGKDPYLVEAHWEAIYQDLLLHGRAGSVMRALSAVDIALWDRNARAAGLPLWKFMGGATEEPAVPAYASGGYYLDGKGLDGLANEIGGYIDAGFGAVKIKVGAVPLREDVERVAVTREVVGPEGVILLDANHAWSDVRAALEAAESFSPYDPFFLEEPFGPDDTRLHEILGQRSPVAVATGELLSGRWAFHRLMSSSAVDYVQPDASACGGITEFRRIAATASSFGLNVWPHWFHDLHVHLVASTPNAGMIEFFPDDHVLNFRRLIAPQLESSAGLLSLPEGPGLGFDFVPEEVERYRVGEWTGAGA